jgi:signal transduction histidine kinase
LVAGPGAAVVIALLAGLAGIQEAEPILFLVPVMGAAWFGGLLAATATATSAPVFWLCAHWQAHMANLPAETCNAALVLALLLLSGGCTVKFRSQKENLTIKRRALAREFALRCQLEEEAAQVRDQEQMRLAMELHDTLGGQLAGLAFRAKAVAETLDREGRPEASEAGQVAARITAALGQTRQLARLLVPMQENATDVSQALAHLCTDFGALFGVKCQLFVDGDVPALKEGHGHHLHQIAREAVRNAIAHGQATEVDVRLLCEPDALVMEIASNGISLPPAQGKPFQGLGLRFMACRSRMLGGSLELEPRCGGGSLVRCLIPVTQRGTAAGLCGRKL